MPNRRRRRAALPTAILAWAALAGAALLAAGCTSSSAADQPGANGKIIAVVQPHRFTRLGNLMEDFAQAFNDADMVYVSPVYAVRSLNFGTASYLQPSSILVGRVFQGLSVGAGMVVGRAMIAASLPATKVEASALGEASDSVRRAAADAAQSGLETAKDAAVSIVDAAAKSVAEADLGGHASHITKNMTGTLKEIADDVVKTALKNPSRSQTT